MLRYKAIGILALSFLLMGSKNVITAPMGDSVASLSGFNISSTHSTRYYEINGDTSAELWRQLRGDANPLSVDPGVGKKPFGDASVSYSYRYQPGYAADLTNCRVISGEIQFKFETNLPRLADLEGKPDRLKKQWGHLKTVISDHEAGHHKIYRQLVKQLPLVLESVGKVPCSELDDRIKVAVNQVVHTMRRASADYDMETGPDKHMIF